MTEQFARFIRLISSEFDTDINLSYNKYEKQNNLIYLCIDIEIFGCIISKCFIINYCSDRIEFNEIYDTVINFIKMYLMNLKRS